MTITNEAQLATSLETLLRLGLDYLGIIDPYDRILVALSALQVYSDKMHKCTTVDDLLAYLVDACDIDSVRDALRDTIQTSKGSESRGVLVSYYITKTDGVTVEDLRDMLKSKLDGMLYGLEGGK